MEEEGVGDMASDIGGKLGERLLGSKTELLEMATTVCLVQYFIFL